MNIKKNKYKKKTNIKMSRSRCSRIQIWSELDVDRARYGQS